MEARIRWLASQSRSEISCRVFGGLLVIRARRTSSSVCIERISAGRSFSRTPSLNGYSTRTMSPNRYSSATRGNDHMLHPRRNHHGRMPLMTNAPMPHFLRENHRGGGHDFNFLSMRKGKGKSNFSFTIHRSFSVECLHTNMQRARLISSARPSINSTFFHFSVVHLIWTTPAASSRSSATGVSFG